MARRLGPHAYVRVQLFPGTPLGTRTAPLRTPAQAQSFCPDFGFREDLPLELDGETLAGLATQVTGPLQEIALGPWEPFGKTEYWF